MRIDCLLAFLQAWQQGDGWESEQEICFSTSSPVLARQGWYLLSSLGYFPRFQRVKPSKKSRNSSYRIRIGRKEARTAFKESHISTSRYFWVGIKSVVRRVYSGPVYDIQVEAPHWYMTSCGLVHNSDMHDYDLWQNRERRLPYKPFINEEAIAPILQPEALTEGQTRARINELLVANGMSSTTFVHRLRDGKGSSLHIEIEQDPERSEMLEKI
jgi:intein/homing endonuclease